MNDVRTHLARRRDSSYRTLCVLLWARPGADDALTAYEDRVLALVSEHGGRI